jgi:hypothetical protein
VKEKWREVGCCTGKEKRGRKEKEEKKRRGRGCRPKLRERRGKKRKEEGGEKAGTRVPFWVIEWG